MRRKIASVLIIAAIMTTMVACGSATDSQETQVASVATAEAEAEDESNDSSKSVKETDYVSIDGIYVDNSYVDKDNENLKMVYVFYTAFTNAENIKVSSKLSEITVNETNTYSSEKYSDACLYMGSYYYSDYLEEVYVGDNLKVVSTFLIPEAELAAGRTLSIKPYGIPDADKIKMTTDDVVFCDSQEEIAELVDPDGYADYQDKYEEADEETTAEVKDAINGYTWEFYVNSTSYEIEFSEPDYFEVYVDALDISNGGTYVVRNGFVSCTYDSNGETVDIPWTWGEDDIDLDVTTAFDVH